MKRNTLLILIIIVALLAAIVYFSGRPSRPTSGGSSEMGGKPFADLAMNDIVAVTITGPSDQVLLRRGSSVWEVENRFGHPADFGKIATLVRGVNDMKIGRSFQADATALARMRLIEPEKTDLPEDQRGVRVVLRDSKDTTLCELIVGRSRDSETGPGGHYLLDVPKKSVYLADRNFDFIDTAPADWIEATLLSVRSADIVSVTCLRSGDDAEKPTYRLHRPEKGKTPELDGPVTENAPDTGKINGLFGALDGLAVKDVADPQADLTGNFKEAPVLEYRTFDGVLYRITPGAASSDSTDRFYVRVTVSYEPPPETPTSEAGEKTGEESTPAETDRMDPAEIRARVEKIHARVSAWTYVVDKWRYEKWITTRTDLMQKKENT